MIKRIIQWRKMTPQQLVDGGYIYWNDNFIYLREKSKWYLIIIPFFRFMLNKPMNFDDEWSKLMDKMTDVSQINPSLYFRKKKEHWNFK